MKVDFIICNNSDLWYSECVKYIENLIVPDNVEIGVIGIADASGMAEGYELGRSSSEADYKVYLHQDTFIINRNFIEDIDAIFRSDDRIGVIGMLGNDDVVDQKFSWESWRWGKVISCTGIDQLLLNCTEIMGKYRVVDCLDGMILVTRYDIPWRRDILTGWHFYDRSICLEYKRKGYLCVVPRQESPWCIHSCGVSELSGWIDSLAFYLSEYQDFFQTDKVLEDMDLPDQDEIRRSGLIADKVEDLINNREMDAAIRLLEEIYGGGVKLNKRLVFIWNLLEIWEAGKYNLFFCPGDNVSDMRDKYFRAVFLLRRKMYGLSLDMDDMLYLTELTVQEKSVILRHELTLRSRIIKSVAMTEVLDTLEQVEQKGRDILEALGNGKADLADIAQNMYVLVIMIDMVEGMIPSRIYEQYDEFFTALGAFCMQCVDAGFLSANVAEMLSSLDLFVECMGDLKRKYRMRIKRCPICGHEVIYSPLPEDYKDLKRLYRVTMVSKDETINEEEYFCPYCGASDRDRLMISFLDKEGLQQSPEGLKLLQIAPASSISRWINLKCPHITYDTTDLYMDNVSFRSDIMAMHMVSDETYDVIICSHVLEHVQDDRKALSELKRILKPDGKIVFLVPIDLNASGIDEEWGLTEAENWRRFGQGDHCRKYDKKGLMQRLEEQFYVHSLGKEYFGEEFFVQCGLTDTSTLYILTKAREVSLNLAEDVVIDERLCVEGPLVSVILPCYNHEQFVAEAIESVINQSYKNIEIIVADDGSTDNTAAVMKKYSSYFAKEIYLTENTGGAVYYRLTQSAKGKYIALMHSDDVWDKDKLALQVAYMEQHEECGVCLSWCLYTDEHLKEYDNSVFRQPNRSSQEWMRFFWKYGNALCNPSSLKRREVELKMKRKAFRQLPDFFTWIDIVQETSIYVMPKVLVRMRWYQKNGHENTSYPTKENMYRHMVEAGNGWYSIIRDMDAGFFKGVFFDEMRNPAAETVEAIKCEKYFLMLNHSNALVQNGAMCYFQEIYDDVKECMEKEYHYTRNDFAKDMLDKGVIKWLLMEKAHD